MKKVLIFLLLIFIFIFGLAVTWFCVLLVMPSKNTETVTLAIKKGDGSEQISTQLKTAGLIKSKLVFKAYLFINNKIDKVQVGEYFFQQTNIPKIVSAITQAKDKRQEISITLVEGWTNNDMAAYLEEKGLSIKEEFLELAQKKEGYLFPDTYRVFIDGSAKDLTDKMLANFDSHVTEEMRQAYKNKGLSLNEAVVLASIVEKEAKLKSDKKIVAGIFLHRLQLGMKLESDATVNYITQKNTTRPSYSDVAVDSLYNTYKYSGLPPGPICNPGLDSLQAVAQPEETDYLYFLNTPNNKLVYSVTGEEHIANKNKYYPD